MSGCHRKVGVISAESHFLDFTSLMHFKCCFVMYNFALAYILYLVGLQVGKIAY